MLSYVVPLRTCLTSRLLSAFDLVTDSSVPYRLPLEEICELHKSAGGDLPILKCGNKIGASIMAQEVKTLLPSLINPSSISGTHTVGGENPILQVVL